MNWFRWSCTITGNTAQGGSTDSGNRGAGTGGGLYLTSPGSTADSSTISGKSADVDPDVHGTLGS